MMHVIVILCKGFWCGICISAPSSQDKHDLFSERVHVLQLLFQMWGENDIMRHWPSQFECMVKLWDQTRERKAA